MFGDSPVPIRALLFDGGDLDQFASELAAALIEAGGRPASLRTLRGIAAEIESGTTEIGNLITLLEFGVSALSPDHRARARRLFIPVFRYFVSTTIDDVIVLFRDDSTTYDNAVMEAQLLRTTLDGIDNPAATEEVILSQNTRRVFALVLQHVVQVSASHPHLFVSAPIETILESRRRALAIANKLADGRYS